MKSDQSRYWSKYRAAFLSPLLAPSTPDGSDGNRCPKEARRGVQVLKTKGSSVLVNTGMAKRNHKKAPTPEDISSKNSVLADQLIGSLDNKYDDSVQKLIDIGKEKGYLTYEEVSDLLPLEISDSAKDFDVLF